jgi:amino acid permease
MEERVSLWTGIRPLVGTVVGVGFFGLPYVFAQASYGLALLELAFLVLVQTFFLWAYADLSLAKKGHARFLRIVGDAFGPAGKFLAVVSFFGVLWGAMTAYILTGGEFLSYIGKAWISDVQPHALSVVLGGVLFLALFGGGFVVKRVQRYLIPLFFIVVAILAVFGFSSVSFVNLAQFSFDAWVLPLGVIIFSLGAISAVPEMRDVLKGNGRQLHLAIFWGLLLVAGAYALFTATVVGIAGTGTPPQAIAAFAGVAPWMVLLGSVLGASVVTTAYVNVGNALVHTLLYDFRVRLLPALFLTGGVPFFLVAMGVDDVIGVLQYSGGVLGALLGILVLIAYEKARRSGQFVARTRAISPAIIFGLFAVFFVMLVMTLRGAA